MSRHSVTCNAINTWARSSFPAKKSKTVQLPVRPATPRLQLPADWPYPVAEGFERLCGSLAFYFARQGAKNVIVILRSGYEGGRSQKTTHDFYTLSSHFSLIKDEITSIGGVGCTFQNRSKLVSRVTQSAVVLRDRMSPAKTPLESQQPISPKISGKRNLENVAEERDRAAGILHHAL